MVMYIISISIIIFHFYTKWSTQETRKDNTDLQVTLCLTAYSLYLGIATTMSFIASPNTDLVNSTPTYLVLFCIWLIFEFNTE
jgi:hypothetical protein